MSARYISPTGMRNSKAVGHSQIGVSGPGERIAMLGGQSGHDRAGRLSATFAGQLAQALRNVAVALAYIDCTLEDVLRLQILIAAYDDRNLGELARQLETTWPILVPPFTLVPVPRLALDGMLVEVVATATVGAGRLTVRRP